MLEGVLSVAGDCRSPLTPDELLSLERTKENLCSTGCDAGRRGYSAEPEDLSMDCGFLEKLLLGSR